MKQFMIASILTLIAFSSQARAESDTIREITELITKENLTLTADQKTHVDALTKALENCKFYRKDVQDKCVRENSLALTKYALSLRNAASAVEVAGACVEWQYATFYTSGGWQTVSREFAKGATFAEACKQLEKTCAAMSYSMPYSHEYIRRQLYTCIKAEDFYK